MKNKCMTLPLFDAVLANKYNAVSRLALLCSQAFRWRWLVAQNLRRCARLFKIMKWIRFPTLFAIAFSTDASELIFRLWTKVNGFQRLVCIVSVICWKDKVLFIYYYSYRNREFWAICETCRKLLPFHEISLIAPHTHTRILAHMWNEQTFFQLSAYFEHNEIR